MEALQPLCEGTAQTRQTSRQIVDLSVVQQTRERAEGLGIPTQVLQRRVSSPVKAVTYTREGTEGDSKVKELPCVRQTQPADRQRLSDHSLRSQGMPDQTPADEV
jgi:hypothetical protein